MISFNVAEIDLTIKRLETLKNEVFSTDSRILDLHIHYGNLIDRAIFQTNADISKADEEHQLCIDVIANNYHHISMIGVEISSARKSAEALKGQEGVTEAEVKAAWKIVSDLESLREDVRRATKSLESIKTQIYLARSTLASQREKLMKSKSQLDKVYYEFQGFYRSSYQELDSSIKRATKAYDAVKGVFTACSVESTKVLIDFRQTMISNVQSINNLNNSMLGKIDYYKKSVLNVDFIEQTAKEALNTSHLLTLEKEKLSKDIKTLDRYIEALKQYEKY